MTKTAETLIRRRISSTCRAIRETWSERERQQRRELAARRQSVLFKILASSLTSPMTRVA